uniref:Uncharacterized protein n=1 Tax=Octopus bimaculoides TaxID=37653 RepID=A0A0L8H434_OCTBM
MLISQIGERLLSPFVDNRICPCLCHGSKQLPSKLARNLIKEASIYFLYYRHYYIFWRNFLKISLAKRNCL